MADILTFPHRGQCDCNCGQHSHWSIVATKNGVKLWFLNIEHLKRWDSIHEPDN